MDKQILSSLLPFWDRLSASEQDLIGRVHQVKHYEAGSIIHDRMNECLGMIRFISGSARTYMISAEGREITLFRMKAPDIDVLSAACVIGQIRFDSRITAETDCDMLVIPAIYLADLKEQNMALRSYIYERLAARFSDTVLIMQDMLFTRVDRRIISFLVRETERTGRNEVRTTHEEIAAKINSSREVVTRVLKELREEGLITLKRGRILITDVRELNAFRQ